MSTIVGTDLFLIARGTTNYQVTAADVAAYTASGVNIQVAAAAPATRSDGLPLQAGDIYYNTADRNL